MAEFTVTVSPETIPMRDIMTSGSVLPGSPPETLAVYWATMAAPEVKARKKVSVPVADAVALHVPDLVATPADVVPAASVAGLGNVIVTRTLFPDNAVSASAGLVPS